MASSGCGTRLPARNAGRCAATRSTRRTTRATSGGVEARATPVVLGEVVTGRQVRSFGRGQWPECIAFSADGKTLAAGAGDRAVRLWDVATGKEIRRLSNFDSNVARLVLASD